MQCVLNLGKFFTYNTVSAKPGASAAEYSARNARKITSAA